MAKAKATLSKLSNLSNVELMEISKVLADIAINKKVLRAIEANLEKGCAMRSRLTAQKSQLEEKIGTLESNICWKYRGALTR